MLPRSVGGLLQNDDGNAISYLCNAFIINDGLKQERFKQEGREMDLYIDDG